jgi:hypothetical protein
MHNKRWMCWYFTSLTNSSNHNVAFQILATGKNYQFLTRKRDCYKAAIFVARAYSCYKAFLSQGPLQPSLKTKVVACLDLMEQHLAPTPPSLKKRKMEPDTSVMETAKSPPAYPDTTPKKRGRPRKQADSLVPEENSPGKLIDSFAQHGLENEKDSGSSRKKSRRSNASASRPVLSASRSDLDLEDDEDDLIPYNPPVRGKGRKTSTNTNKIGKGKPSLSAIMTQFEEQYEAMGKMYHQLGSTIQELKSYVQENRTATEQELRNELLQEVQSTLLKTLGKN